MKRFAALLLSAITAVAFQAKALPIAYPPSNKVTFSKRGSISERSAGVPLAGAEIAAFDSSSKRAFLSSASGVEVIDLANPDAPVFVKTLDLTAAPFNLTSNNVSSVTSKNGVLAAAVIANPKTANGTVIFIDAATDALLGTVAVGSVPDHVGFTPDGNLVLVAIEGELTDTADVNSDPATDTIPGGVAIIDVSGGFASASVTTADFAAFDAQAPALSSAGVRIFAGGKPSTDFEPEYFAVSPDSSTAMVTLQEANAVGILDIATATFTSVVPLGEKDFSTLMADFSDRDGAGASNLINPTTGNPVFGLYMPDQIASFESDGQLYFITANEGDDRDDFLPVAESARLKDAAYDLDDATFPTETTLKEDANLGRLTVSNAPGLRGDSEPDGDVDRILTYGARSFSIWDTNGTLVYDSGDMIEMIVASQFPANFDDGRSDNKGPEPEGVTVLDVNGFTLAFVGLERSNMVLVFDVSNPVEPTYVTALENAGDVSPEGILAVSATDSPSGRPLILVSNEVSNSLTVYQANPELIITELLSNQDSSGNGDYWELTNAGDSTVDLSNWSWDDNSVTPGVVSVPPGTMIAPGESVIFTAVDAATFRAWWGLPTSVQVINGAGAPGLGGGDGVYLFDAADVLITSFDYDAGGFIKVDGNSSLGGHAGASAGGALDSQAAVIDPFYGTGTPRYTFADGTTLGTFASTASANELGSPGSAFLTPQLLVTELLSNEASSGTEDYWELTNVGVSSVDLSDWSWDDDSAIAGTVRIPNGVSIAPGESIILTKMDAASFRNWWGLPETVQVITGTSAPGLGGGDAVFLFDERGNQVTTFSYAALGFTRSDGSSSIGGHAGLSAGGPSATVAVIIDPLFGTETPRYTAADGVTNGTFASTLSTAEFGSPGDALLGSTAATVSIADASVTEGDSGTTTLSLVVTRSDTDAAFTVDYAVTGGSATLGVDFVALASGTLTFSAAGLATQPIDITVNGDTDPEDDETIVVTLSNVVNGTGTTIIAIADGTGTILNDDAIAPTITSEPAGTTIASGGVTTLVVAADGFPASTYQWYEGNSGDTIAPVGGPTSGTFVTPSLTGTTRFWARATNTAGTADSAAATVTVVPAITSVDLSQYVRVGRYDLPEPTRTALPPGTAAHNLLCQEASAVTYNWDTDTLFVTGDGGRAITQVSKTGELIDTMTLALGSSPQGTDFYDPEGLTYVGGGQFVMSEERDRNLVRFTYAAGTTLTRTGAQTVNIGPFVDNTGTEGLTFDPVSGGLICLKEISPIGIFQTDVDFGLGTATNKATGSVESTNLFDPALLGMSDVADVFALANLSGMAGQAQEPFLIVIGQEDARVVNVDRFGNIQSTLQIVTDVGNPLSAANQQHEGVTMDPVGNLYVVNENGGGDADRPQLWVYAPATGPNAAPTQIVLNNPVNAIDENTSTASPIKVADIVVVDDGLGTNDLSLSGADAVFFEIVGTELFLKSGTVLDFETQASYSLVIEADDITVGSTPDVTENYSLTVNDLEPETPPAPALIISEVAAWSSSSAVGSDWFEVTNTTDNPIDITGWKVDDGSASFASALELTGVTSIAAGESVIFIEDGQLPATVSAFLTQWFGSTPPSGLQIGGYTGSGIGLSSNGDEVNLYNAAGVLQANVAFGASPSSAPLGTFDNTIGLNAATLVQLSVVGVNGAFTADATADEVGSPGFAVPGVLRITEVAPWSSGNSPVVAADWFEVTNMGARSVDIRGWKVDDGSESPAAAVPLFGIDSIAPGESVIFVESSTPSTTVANFVTNWFGGTAPSGLQIGTYTGSGIGLSTGGDAVNLYDTRAPTPARRASVSFGASPTAAPFGTFDNSAGLDVAAVSQLSVVGVNGAYAVAGGDEIGSPGAIATAAPVVDFTLQILHYYGESGLVGVETAPIMGALIDRFEDDFANTLVVAEGDSFIPGPWLVAGADPSLSAISSIGSTALGRPDMAIMNLFGTDVSALGNHEFDLGSPVLAGAFRGSGAWGGAQFPFITANLDFSADGSLASIADASIGGSGGALAGSEVTALAAKIAPYAVKTVNGELIGFVGATNWELLTKSSPNGTVPKDDGNGATSDLEEVAIYVQAAVDALELLGVNKIVMVDQLDDLQRNKDLAGLVSGIDIMVAGGGHERLGDANDTAVPFNGHDGDFIATDTYPITTTDLDGNPTLIVTTDTEYTYLGRLVADFDASGKLIVSTLDDTVNGAYASVETTLQAAYGTSDSAATIIASSTIATSVKEITDAINAVAVAKDSTVYGFTNVYLEGDRVFGRVQEVNLGNITADANAWKARTALGLAAGDSVFSLKNGGGIRASIGSVLGDGTKVGPFANAITGKPANGISQLDVENALRFNNRLMVFDVTPAGLLAILEHAAGLSSGPTNQNGGYPQVGNLRFSYDAAQTPGSKVRSVALVNDAGQITARIVENGVVLPGAPATIPCVGLNFTVGVNAGIDAAGGDGYPIKANATNFRFLLDDGTVSAPIDEALSFTDGAVVPANALGEQQAFADFLLARHPAPGNAYAEADTPVAQDTRIQQIAFRADAVLSGPETVAAWLAANGYTSGGLFGDSDNNGVPDVIEYFFNQDPNNPGDLGNLPQVVVNGGDLEFRFAYNNGSVFPGYLKCSTDLITWINAVEGLDYEVITETVNGGETVVRYRIFCDPTPTPEGPFTYLTPYTSEVDGGALNGLTITNHGLVGVGRLSGSALDAFGETLGAASGLYVSNWGFNSGSGQFTGTFNVLPDRGFNADVGGTPYFSNYAARVHELPFTFTPYYGAGPTAQGQIVPTYASSTKFTYNDGGTIKFTTGLNAINVTNILGQPVGTVPAANGPSGAITELISFDAEAIHLFADGSGYVSDEYGTYIARFSTTKEITQITQLSTAAQPHKPVATLNFDSTSAPSNGRRNNQGLEGMSVSPDETRLFALMQSALVQDTGTGQQGRYNTRLFVYDIVGSNREAPVLIGEYAVQLPRYDISGDGSGLDRTAAQSEIVAISNTQLLMLPRDGNGLGTGSSNPIVAKTVDLVDFSDATNIVGLFDNEGDQISPGAVLNASITPARSTVVINLASATDLAKFGLNTNTAAPDSNTLNEKLEGFGLVPDLSTPSPEDYFLFVANDNDFQSPDVRMLKADGTGLDFLGDQTAGGIVNDAMFYAWRITICTSNHKFFRIEVDTSSVAP